MYSNLLTRSYLLLLLFYYIIYSVVFRIKIISYTIVLTLAYSKDIRGKLKILRDFNCKTKLNYELRGEM